MSSYREAFAIALGLMITWSASLTGVFTHLDNGGRILGSLIVAPVQSNETVNSSVDFNALNRAEVQLFRQIDQAMTLSDPSDGNALKKHKNALVIADQTPLDYETSLILVDYAEEFNLNPSLILAIIETESNFNPTEVGTHQDRGLMQIIPPTERWLAKDMGKDIGLEYNPERIFDPEYNIGLAAIYLSTLRDAYGNNFSRILSEYNRGPYNLARYFQNNGTYSTGYSKNVLSREVKYLAFNQ